MPLNHHPPLNDLRQLLKIAGFEKKVDILDNPPLIGIEKWTKELQLVEIFYLDKKIEHINIFNDNTQIPPEQFIKSNLEILRNNKIILLLNY